MLPLPEQESMVFVMELVQFAISVLVFAVGCKALQGAVKKNGLAA